MDITDTAVMQYTHHGKLVWVNRSLLGTHREHCLCFHGCAKFKPGTPENCPKAQELYEFCVRNSMTTPVFECPDYQPSN